MDGPTTLWSKAQGAALCDFRQRETRPKSVASGPDALVVNKVPREARDSTEKYGERQARTQQSRRARSSSAAVAKEEDGSGKH